MVALITSQSAGWSSKAAPASGYDGWWNATSVSGDVAGLPFETITVDTNSGKIIDAFNRAKNEAGQPTSISDISFHVVRDPAWPRDAIVVIDTATGNVIEQFPARGTSK